MVFRASLSVGGTQLFICVCGAELKKHLHMNNEEIHTALQRTYETILRFMFVDILLDLFAFNIIFYSTII